MKIIKRFFAAIIILGLLAAAVLAVVLLNPAWLFRTGAISGEFASGGLDRDRVNIALLGFDGGAERDELYSIYRPDTIMIASINLRTRDISLANIPRDSYVAIAGTGIHDKINHAYMHGYLRHEGEDPHRAGIDTTLRTIEDFLGGVPVHHYVSMDMDAVVEIVDTVGGVYHDVEHPVRADLGRGRVLVEQGYQLLGGEKFLHYVRDRGTGGDTGRSRRQQQILLASLPQLKDPKLIWNAGPLYRVVKEDIETDLKTLQLAALGLLGLRADTGAIKTYIFPGSIQYAPSGGVNISYIVIDEARRVELIREIFDVTVAGRPQITLPGPVQAVAPAPQPDSGSPAVTDPEPEKPGPDPEPEPEMPPGEPGPPGDENEDDIANGAPPPVAPPGQDSVDDD